MFSLCLLSVYFEGVPWERWILRDPSKMRVHARLSFIVTTNLPSFVRLIRCFIGRSKPLGRLEEFGQAVFDKEVKIQRSPGTPSSSGCIDACQICHDRRRSLGIYQFRSTP